MSWLGIADAEERRFSLRGVGDDRSEAPLHPSTDAYMLARGTLMFEARMMPDARPERLLGFDQTWPDRRSLVFHAVPGGGVAVVQETDGHTIHTALQHSVDTRTQVLRISFSWDAPRGWAQLTVERPESYGFKRTLLEGVKPIPITQLRNIVLGRDGCRLNKDVVYVALSDKIEPVGPMPGLAPTTHIDTPGGPRCAGHLGRGDLVITRDGQTVPILHRVQRSVPARGGFAPVRLRAPYFELRKDIVVAPHQRLVVGGSEVEYLFGTEAVLLPARHLINGFTAQYEPPPVTTIYLQFILPKHEAVRVAGASLESLYIGRLRRDPDVWRKTILAGLDRNTLPEHGRPAFKELQWYEAIHLARQRAA